MTQPKRHEHEGGETTKRRNLQACPTCGTELHCLTNEWETIVYCPKRGCDYEYRTS